MALLEDRQPLIGRAPAPRSHRARGATNAAPAAPVSEAPPRFRADIEGLRAVAVSVVVFFHAGASILAGGYVGVDVFFVISGYLITTQLLREWGSTGTISIGRFYARRALRLLPASAFVVVVTLLAAWLWMPPVRLKDLAVDAFTTTFYGMNYHLAVEGTDYLGAAQPPSPLQHFWSLAVEEQFYLVWPLLLLALVAAMRRRPGATTAVVLGALFVVIGASFALSVWQTSQNAPWAYFGAHTRAWELAVGALVAVWVLRRPVRLRRGWVIAGRWIGLAGIAGSAMLYTEQTAFPGYAAALPVVATALVIVVGCADSDSRFLGNPAMQFVGRHSYAWYLWHWPVLIIGSYAFEELTLANKVILAVLALLLSVITAHRVETPFRTNARLRSRARSGLLVGVALSVAVAGLAVVYPAVAPPTTGTGAAADAAAVLGQSATDRSEAERKLIELIEQSAAVKVVPANLTPSVTKADSDVGRNYHDGCDLTFTQFQLKKRCVYGAVDSPTTVVLFGDSHAGHWFPAVNAIAKKRKWRLVVLAKAACSAASARIHLPNLGREYTECGRWRDAAIDYIGTLQPKMIITSSNGHGDMLDPGGSQDTGWANAWATTFSRLPRSAKLVYISDTAWPAGDAPTCVSNNLSSLDKCHRPRAEAVSNLPRRRLAAETARRAGGAVIDPAPWMCTAKVCPAVIGNVLVHKDDSHLSATFARLLTPVLDRYIPQLR